MNNEFDIDEAPTSVHWSKILIAIYNYSPNTIWETDEIHRGSDNHLLAKKLKISGSELCYGVIFLLENKYIEVIKVSKKPYKSYWKLTSKGVDIALKNIREDNSERFQEVVALGTFLLALIGFVSYIRPEKLLSTTFNKGLLYAISIGVLFSVIS